MYAEQPKLPDELSFLSELEFWNVLPCAGGLLDQPYTLMRDLEAVRKAQIDHENVLLARESLQDKVDAVMAQAYQAAGLARSPE